MHPLHVTGAALAIVIVATCADASAQNVVLRAADGGTEHQLYVSGLMGVYIVGPASSPIHARVACAVHLEAEGRRYRLDIHAPIQLGSAARPACDRSALPRVSLNEARDSGVLLVGPRARALRTAAATSASFVYPSEREAIGAAASIAQALGQAHGNCGYLDSDAVNGPPRDHAFGCWTGLTMSVYTSTPDVRLVLQHQYVRPVGHCEGFAEAHDFRELWISDAASLCAHGHVLLARDGREQIARALGPCRELPGGGEGVLRCGAYEVRIEPGESIQVRRASP